MERRNTNIHKLIIYILITLAGACFLFLFTYQNICIIKAKIQEYNYNAQCEIYNQMSLEYDEINKQVEDAKNIDDRISLRKAEYFSNISILEQKILNGQSNVKIAYLTIDDGPYRLTESFLNVLRDYNVRATFFVRGFTDDESLATYQREYEEGHTIANHTYSHNTKIIYSSVNAFMSDVLKLQYMLKEKIGITTNIVRFPAGSPAAGSQKSAIVQRLVQEGYGYVDWQAVSGDGGDRTLTPQKAYDNVLRTVGDRKIVVILIHDYNSKTLGGLPNIITALRDKGYIFLPLFKDSVMVQKQ